MKPQRILFAFFILLSQLTILGFAGAEDLFQWRDSRGNLVFGSKAPKGATEVRKVKSAPISRYSSDRLVSSLRNRSGSSSSGTTPSALSAVVRQKKESSSQESVSASSQTPSEVTPSAKKGKKSSAKTARARLEDKPSRAKALSGHALLNYQQPVLTVNEKSEVTSCSVEVRNEGGTPANRIVLQLAFPDGSFVTSIGPDSLASGEKAIYALPSKSIPLKLVTFSGPPYTAESAKPEVIVSYE